MRSALAGAGPAFRHGRRAQQVGGHRHVHRRGRPANRRDRPDRTRSSRAGRILRRSHRGRDRLRRVRCLTQRLRRGDRRAHPHHRAGALHPSTRHRLPPRGRACRRHLRVERQCRDRQRRDGRDRASHSHGGRRFAHARHHRGRRHDLDRGHAVQHRHRARSGGGCQGPLLSRAQHAGGGQRVSGRLARLRGQQRHGTGHGLDDSGRRGDDGGRRLRLAVSHLPDTRPRSDHRAGHGPARPTLLRRHELRGAGEHRLPGRRASGTHAAPGRPDTSSCRCRAQAASPSSTSRPERSSAPCPPGRHRTESPGRRCGWSARSSWTLPPPGSRPTRCVRRR